MLPQNNVQKAALIFRSAFERNSHISNRKERWIGLENEYPVVQRSGDPIDKETLKKFWSELANYGWDIVTDATTGSFVHAIRYRDELKDKKYHHFDVISTDFGYSTLEIALAPAKSLFEAENSLKCLINDVTNILEKFGCLLLGYGMQPKALPERQYLASKARYQIIYDIREDENHKDHPYYSVGLHCLNAASQTQIEVSAEEACVALNALNATSGLRIALCANAPVWRNRISEYKAIRQMFWEWCWPQRNQQFGIPPRFQSIEHYVDYIIDFRSLMVKRENAFFRIDNNQSFRQFLLDGNEQQAYDANNEKRTVKPQAKDILTHYAFAWFNTRLHPIHGTIEDRVICQQLPNESISPSALLLGLIENIDEISSVSNRLSLGQWREIYYLACQNGLDFQYPGVDVRELIQEMLDIAQMGLNIRGHGEEKFLQPLYNRLEKGNCPANIVMDEFRQKGMDGLLKLTNMKEILDPAFAKKLLLEECV